MFVEGKTLDQVPWASSRISIFTEASHDLRFGRFPVFELGCPIVDSLTALIENLFMPFRRLNRFWRSLQVLPECFHHSELFFNRHFM
jgi:hypothetical protein